MEPCWGYFSLLGASWGNFPHLLRLMSLLAGFCASWGALARFWRLPRGSGEGFGCPKALFFEVFLPAHACNAKKARQAFCIGKTNTKRMSAIQRTTLKTNKIRPGRLSNNVFCQDCAKNLSWRSPSSVLEESGSLGGSSWVHLAGFWVLLGGSWPLLGASWASALKASPFNVGSKEGGL